MKTSSYSIVDLVLGLVIFLVICKLFTYWRRVRKLEKEFKKKNSLQALFFALSDASLRYYKARAENLPRNMNDIFSIALQIELRFPNSYRRLTQKLSDMGNNIPHEYEEYVLKRARKKEHEMRSDGFSERSIQRTLRRIRLSKSYKNAKKREDHENMFR